MAEIAAFDIMVHDVSEQLHLDMLETEVILEGMLYDKYVK